MGNQTILAGLLCGLTLAVSSCGDGALGACDSTGRYCGDDYTKAECEERDDLEVNGERWTHHPGQTCAERGKESTS